MVTWRREELAVQSLVAFAAGGKSGLHRAERQVTPGRREPTESATENIPPPVVPRLVLGFAGGKGEMVR